MLLRKVWTDKNNVQILERAIPELAFMNKPLSGLEASEMRPLARTLGLSLNLEEQPNLDILLQVLELKTGAYPTPDQGLAGRHSTCSVKCQEA